VSDLRRVQAAIERYAVAYDDLQRLQHPGGLIPPGDQKTGCIGEFYARLFLLARYPGAPVSFAGHSQSGWDMEVATSVGVRRFQIKTVSAHSKTRRISPISSGWDELFVVFLDLSFQPAGFWVISDSSVVPEGSTLRHCCSPRPGFANAGSAKLPFGPDRVAELREAVLRALEA
jgi:hypothetical protein